MSDIESIKRSIEQLYQTNPKVCISVNKTRPKIVIEDLTANIIGIYRNIFQVEELKNGKPFGRHTFQYSDVLMGQVVIKELNYTPIFPASKRK